jgi:hypothetical protein
MKKTSDIWDIYVETRDKLCERYKDTPFLATAILEVRWSGYVQALYDFGIIDDENDFDSLKVLGMN